MVGNQSFLPLGFAFCLVGKLGEGYGDVAVLWNSLEASGPKPIFQPQPLAGCLGLIACTGKASIIFAPCPLEIGEARRPLDRLPWVLD